MIGIALLRMKAPRRRVQNVDFSGYFGIQVNGTEANYKYKRSLRRLLSFDITVYSYRNTTLINEHRYIPSTRFERIPVSHGSHYLVIYVYPSRSLYEHFLMNI